MTRELGDRMVADERFKLLTFTGSPSVGWRMKERAGKKKVVLELGGNAGVIVDKTADLDWAVKRMPRRRVRATPARSASASSGCSSTRTSGTRSWSASSQGARALKVGDPLDPTTDLGPMVDGDGRRPDPALGRRGGRAGRQAPARRQGRRHVLPADDPDRRPGDRPGLLERGVRAARRRLPVPRLRRRDRAGQRLDVRAPDRRLHERPGQRLAGVRRARGRRRHRQRRPDLPDRPHALRRRQGLRPRPRGPALGDRGHDRDPDHGAGPAAAERPPALRDLPRASRGPRREPARRRSACSGASFARWTSP